MKIQSRFIKPNISKEKYLNFIRRLKRNLWRIEDDKKIKLKKKEKNWNW